MAKWIGWVKWLGIEQAKSKAIMLVFTDLTWRVTRSDTDSIEG